MKIKTLVEDGCSLAKISTVAEQEPVAIKKQKSCSLAKISTVAEHIQA